MVKSSIATSSISIAFVHEGARMNRRDVRRPWCCRSICAADFQLGTGRKDMNGMPSCYAHCRMGREGRGHSQTSGTPREWPAIACSWGKTCSEVLGRGMEGFDRRLLEAGSSSARHGTERSAMRWEFNHLTGPPGIRIIIKGGYFGLGRGHCLMVMGLQEVNRLVAADHRLGASVEMPQSSWSREPGVGGTSR
ncbi:hypothetical protein PVAP13_1NG456900 [Panicum virgatum]|uniref:Uncharacterized protein n=1 Tax=Panicum virgatum TaxID=38727 RepID=A0A8T0WW24_PANVG|nr:hypothetical protein PVAP13_1NG456900 [Panicum virgatum]